MTLRRFITCTGATAMVIAASVTATMTFWRTVFIGTCKSIRLIWRAPPI